MQDNVQEAGAEYSDPYATVATDCIRYFGMSFDEIDRLTIPEYKILMKAQAYIEVDKEHERSRTAWLTMAASATKKDGKPVYKHYTDFFDYEAELKRIDKKPSDKFNNLSKHLKEKRNGTTGSKSDTDCGRP